MILHVDTSFLVDLLRERRRRQQGPASHFLAAHLDDELRISVFVACELFTGVERAKRREVERRKVEAICAALPIVVPDRLFAPAYGRLLASQQRRGEVIATMDLLIATAAVVDGAPVVTRNVRHFARVAGLRVLSY